MDYRFTTPFDATNREQIAVQVVTNLRKVLPGLCVDWSYECGFNLPLTDFWLKKDYGEISNKIIQYHGSRQLRFYFSLDNKLVTGLRYKDGIKYWTEDEVEILLNGVNEVIVNG
jgi:hypothetical protein